MESSSLQTQALASLAKPTSRGKSRPQSSSGYSTSSGSADILCCYQNRTPEVQVIRSATFYEEPRWHMERVVFPGQRLLFKAPQQGLLKIFTHSPVGSSISDTVACNRLRVRKQSNLADFE